MSDRPDYWKVYEMYKEPEGSDYAWTQKEVGGVITTWDHNALILAVENLKRDGRLDTAADVAAVLRKIGGPPLDIAPMRHGG